jgi:hypothetical protein
VAQPDKRAIAEIHDAAATDRGSLVLISSLVMYAVQCGRTIVSTLESVSEYIVFPQVNTNQLSQQTDISSLFRKFNKLRGRRTT